MATPTLTDWITAVATVVYAVANSALLLFLIWQIRELERGRRLNAVLSLFREYGGPQAVRARTRIYAACFDAPTALQTSNTVPPELRQAIEDVIYSFSELGVLLYRGLIDRHTAAEWLPTMPARLWMLVRGYFIDWERRHGVRTPGFKYVCCVSLGEWLRRHPDADDHLIVFHPDRPETVHRFSRVELEEQRRRLIADLQKTTWWPLPV